MLRCPVCKSREIYPVVGGYIGQVYFCKDCKYRGSFVLEVDDEPDTGCGEKEKYG
jgi:transposase-like protein